MNQLSDTAYSSPIRPKLTGSRGAVSAAHPLGVAAAQQVLAIGGNAVDAAIAAQATLCVVIPASCGLGGDALVLIREPDGSVAAINGTGCSPADPAFSEARNGGLAVTVPGMVDAWASMSARHGKLDLGQCLEPAIALANRGVVLGADLARAVRQNARRLEQGGASGWRVMEEAGTGAMTRQPGLAAVLQAVGKDGPSAFYQGEMAEAVVRAARSCGGLLTVSDLAGHKTETRAPINVDWQGGRVFVQPPMTQGVLLAMCLKALNRLSDLPAGKLDHALIELTEASFAHRDCACDGEALLEETLEIDLDRASNRGGPRAYLHTAGVAAADGEGRVVSSLVSVFDEFGSGVFVPEGGFVLNNRAQGFTSVPNDAAPAKRPVHTLAPALIENDGRCFALATPGADGQIQTLLQILAKHLLEGLPLDQAIHHPRWRSEDGNLLVAENHPERGNLQALGHKTLERADGDTCFGGVVCAGNEQGLPFAVSDWRREVWSGVW